MNQNEDILGKALIDFQNKKELGELVVSGEGMDNEIMDISYYFRSYKNMPELEKIALAECKGRVLDFGAGAGSHALYLQEIGMDVSALDISPGALEVMKARGIENTILASASDQVEQTFDTVLLLMNGIGIAGTLEKLPGFIAYLFTFLDSKGQLLFDSSDLRYLYEEEDGSFWIDLNAAYYGEMNFAYSYKGEQGQAFDWLYIDKESLQVIADEMELKLEIVHEADNYHYLARLTRN
jgi:SAM-dependent methyltransferase